MSQMDERRSWAVPEGACDTHFHIYEPEHPMGPGSHIPAQPCSLVDYQKNVAKRLGVSRFVVVQPTAYGEDNSVTLRAMAELGNARGIAVLDENISDEKIVALDALGIRGFRFFSLSGDTGWDRVPKIAQRAADHGWHVQFQFDGAQLSVRAPLLTSLPCDIVIDHIGRLHPPINDQDPQWKALRGLLDTGRCWVKLSAPYHGSKLGPPHYADMGLFAQQLVMQAPERMLWASNWPHPMVKSQFPDEQILLDVLREWVPDQTTWHQVLVSNPAKLYRF